jgi:hypothetical protein
MLIFKYIAAAVSRAGRLLAVLAVVITASAVTMLAAAFASGLDSGNAGTAGAGFSVFSHPPSGIARISNARGLNPPPGAILATVEAGNEVYAWQPSTDEVCVVDLEVAGLGGVACDLKSHAETHGVVLILRPAPASAVGPTLSMAAMVPDGVKSVVFSKRDGSTHQAAVTNNIVELADPNLASVRYTSLDGVNHEQAVPTQSPSATTPPGPGSSG